MPGCTAVPEILQAKALGAKVITVLPGNVLGAEFIAPVAKQHPDLRFIPSGETEITHPNLTKWFEANALCVKLNTTLFPKDALSIRDWLQIESNVLSALKTIRQVKTSVQNVNSDLLIE